jgi:hypothetical protein
VKPSHSKSSAAESTKKPWYLKKPRMPRFEATLKVIQARRRARDAPGAPSCAPAVQSTSVDRTIRPRKRQSQAA